jgi:hypothetical protein
MRLTKEQVRVVQNGQAVHLRRAGLDCVVIRADLYDRLATLFVAGNRSAEFTAGDLDAAGASRDQPKKPVGGHRAAWSEERNDRRCLLIDKDIEGSITEAEKLELQGLQVRFHEYLDSVAPPPMEGARRLHRQLLDKKRQRERRG